MIYIILGIVLVTADQLTKFWARGALSHGAAEPFLPNIMDFVYVENRGAAFGILQDTRFLLIAVTAAVIVLLLFYTFKTKRRNPAFCLSAALICTGGIGNMIDRIIFGYVTDFIHLLFIDFPCFNLADICVCTGGALIVIFLLFFDRQAQRKEHADE